MSDITWFHPVVLTTPNERSFFQYPDTEGSIMDFTNVVQRAKENGVSIDL